MRRSLSFVLVVLIAVVVSPAVAQERAYKVTLKGLEEGVLKKKVSAASELIRLEGKEPPTFLGLRQRIRSDRTTLRGLLRSEGYYSEKVDINVESTAEGPRVVIEIEPGPPYLLSAYEMVPVEPGEAGPQPPIGLTEIGIVLGQPARAETIIKAQERLIKILAERAHPLAKVENRRVVVDHAKKRARVTLRVAYGPKVSFGSTKLVGLDGVDRAFVLRRVKWKSGAAYDSKRVDETRTALLGTGLFATVKIARAPRPEADGTLPMVIELTNRKPRTIALGASYSTNTGPGGSVSWIHRNLFGGAERLDLTAEASFIEYSGKAQLRKPDIFDGPQDLILGAEILAQRFDSYDADIFRTSATVERRFGQRWRASVGLLFEQEEINDQGVDESFSLIGLPLQARYDSTDSLLNPVRGWRLRFDATPYKDVTRADLEFAEFEATASTYWSLVKDDRVILATWARIGTILGADRAEVPASKRLYSGGGGSVRGFGFQKVGPLDASNDPLGGTSKLEFGVEARFRVFKSWGLVAFLEGGNIAEKANFNFEETFRFGAGFGIRYFTGFGPLRVDVAFPINRRRSDARFQIYVSIGQAF